MTDQAEGNTMGPIYEAGDGFCFIVAKTGAGRFQVFARDPGYCDGAFYPWHPNGIRREGAEAMAKWAASRIRDKLSEMANPEKYPCADMELAATLSGNDRIAEDFDAATALLPYLEHAPDPWKLAEEIACARPWEMPGSPTPADIDSDIPF